jgi:hypothetical protein
MCLQPCTSRQQGPGVLDLRIAQGCAAALCKPDEQHRSCTVLDLLMSIKTAALDFITPTSPQLIISRLADTGENRHALGCATCSCVLCVKPWWLQCFVVDIVHSEVQAACCMQLDCIVYTGFRWGSLLRSAKHHSISVCLETDALLCSAYMFVATCDVPLQPRLRSGAGLVVQQQCDWTTYQQRSHHPISDGNCMKSQEMPSNQQRSSAVVSQQQQMLLAQVMRSNHTTTTTVTTIISSSCHPRQCRAARSAVPASFASSSSSSSSPTCCRCC